MSHCAWQTTSSSIDSGVADCRQWEGFSASLVADHQMPCKLCCRVSDEHTSVCSTGPQAGRLSGAGTRLCWPPHDVPTSSEIAQYMPCSLLPSQKFSEACTEGAV